MRTKRQNIQLELAWEPAVKGEARSTGAQGTEARMARAGPERPAAGQASSLLKPVQPLKSVEPPCTDPYARWCGRGGAARLPPIPISGEPNAQSTTQRPILPDLRLSQVRRIRPGYAAKSTRLTTSKFNGR